jgi:fucose permease
MRWRYKPSKPAAVFSALVCVGMLVFGIAGMKGDPAFVAFWCVVVVGIAIGNLWAAFSPRGSLYTMQRSDDPDAPPHRFGTRSERD